MLRLFQGSKPHTTLVSTFVFGATMAFATFSHAADPIVGNWQTQSEAQAKISPCGSAFCIKLTSGKYAGKNIGRLKGKGKSYSGTVKDPTDDKSYSGTAKVNGGNMKLRGCFLKVFCKTQNWRKL